MEFDKVKLDNGLTIYLLNDKNKHVTLANLIINFGGIDNCYFKNGKKKKLKNGLAHFLEHVVLESSKYGDLMEIFGDKGVRSNGLTSLERTEFYIDTVDNFYENLSLLIRGIHNTVFEDKIIDDIRKPIQEEKRRSLDNKYANLYNANVSTYLNNKNFKSILGDMSDIKNIKKNDLKDAYKAFYKPTNEILVISGNFSKNKVINVIKRAYNEIKFDKDKIERIKYRYNDKVNKKHLIIKDNTNIGRSIITFKINTMNKNEYDKMLYDIYVYSFLRMNFGITSKINKYLIQDNIIIGNLNFNTSVIDGYYIIKIEANTNNYNKFKKTILDYIKNKEFILDKELFKLYKKEYIIDIIVRNDSIYNILEPFIHNIIFFNYDRLDNVTDIENISFKKFQSIINKINFNNYSITELKPK